MSVITSESIANSLTPPDASIDLDQFTQGICPDGASGVTDTTLSPIDLTNPSLWWIRDQFSAQAEFGSKLLEKWLACPAQPQTNRRVDVLVNPQLWTLLDYLERYEFVHRLGTVTSRYRYDLRVFNRQKVLLATYTCQSNPADKEKGELNETMASISPPASSLSSLPCALALDSSSKGGFRGRSSSFDGGLPTGGGTGQP